MTGGLGSKGLGGEQTAAGVSSHVDLTNKEVAGIIDHADNSISAVKLRTDSVETAKIKDGAITQAKLNTSLNSIIAYVNVANTFTQDQTIQSAKKLHFGTGNSYIVESFSGQLDIYNQATRIISLSNSLNRARIENYNLSVQATKNTFYDGGGDTARKESSSNVLDDTVGGVRTLRQKGSGVSIQGKIFSKAGAITTSELDDGYFTVYKNTSTGDVKLAVNDGGTIKEGSALT